MAQKVEIYPDQIVDRDYQTGHLVVDLDGERAVVRARNVRYLPLEEVTVEPVVESDLAQQASQRPLGFAVAQHAVQHYFEAKEL